MCGRDARPKRQTTPASVGVVQIIPVYLTGRYTFDLAAHAKLIETYICELEKGKWEITISTLERLAKALDMEISELFKAIGR
jgi:transcriptional regulator with XRE-family HTH domain